jgi:HK97 family phage portal protein
LEEGNAYALAIRNNRFEVDQLHQFDSRSTRAYVSQTGEIFYSVGGNPVMDYRQDPAFAAGTRWIVPARDVLHIKGPAPKDPLHGESPLVAGGLPIWMNSGGSNYFMRFFQNMSRPSGVIETDNTLTGQQANELRARWEEHTKGVNIGGTPILTMGMKWKPMGMTSQDAQIAEAMKMSVADIARLFGVPLALIDSMEGSTYSNVEQLIMVWLRQGLGFYIDNIELAFDKLFAIERTTEYTEFNVDALLRPDFKSRVEGLTRAVQGGIYAPNEARKIEGLAAAKDGDEPRVQMQVVPLSVNAEKPEPPKPAPAPVAPPPDGEASPPKDEEKPPPEKLYTERALKAFMHLARTGTDG